MPVLLKIFSMAIMLLLLVMCICEMDADQQKEREEQQCQKQSHAEAAVNSDETKSMALVPYDEDNIIFATFHKPERQFTFLGRSLIISQDWRKHGVAAVVWDAAIVMSEYLTQHQEIVRNRSVLELGAGMGLVGMVAALAGGKVTCTEREEALDRLQASVSSNFDSAVHNLTVTTLDWTRDQSDWDADFDVILGADIVYIEDTFFDLLRTFLHFAREDTTTVLLSCKIRYKRDSKFLSMMEEHFSMKKVHSDLNRDIHIYSAKRNRW